MQVKQSTSVNPGKKSKGDINLKGKKASKDNKVRFTVTNICDFIAFCRIPVLMELKSTEQASMPFANIKKHQIEEMYKASSYKYVNAYFIFNFRKVDQTFAIKADKAHDFYIAQTRKSYPISWCQEHGILITQTKKRTHFKYDVSPLLNKSEDIINN
jgi:recombination protein U